VHKNESMMPQNVAESSLDAEYQLARDWTAFQAGEAGAVGTVCRVWQTPRPVVVVGRHGGVAADVLEANCEVDQVPVLRRVSGGGAVVLGRGSMNYSMVFSLVSHPELTGIAESFHIVLRAIVEALDVPGLSIDGGTDLVLHGRKVSGNAQRRGRRTLLHHGTLLYDFHPGLAVRYLKEPIRRPAYRGGRSHSEFIGNLPLSAATIRTRLGTAWQAFGYPEINRRKGDE
jgi:lipoate---protein ligase